MNFAVIGGFRISFPSLFRNPLVTISVGLTINGKLVIGIINAPCIGKLYAAVKGRGATCNGKPMKVWNNEANYFVESHLNFLSNFQYELMLITIPQINKLQKSEFFVRNNLTMANQN